MKILNLEEHDCLLNLMDVAVEYQICELKMNCGEAIKDIFARKICLCLLILHIQVHVYVSVHHNSAYTDIFKLFFLRHMTMPIYLQFPVSL